MISYSSSLYMQYSMIVGTESETKEFMQVCVQTVKKYPLDDQVSPVFIFERLCSIIFPVSITLFYLEFANQNPASVFLILLNKLRCSAHF